VDLREAVEDAVASLPLVPADVAARVLALTYAGAIDDAWLSGDPLAITKALYLGPHLLRCLESLGATPAGRAAIAAKTAEVAAKAGAEKGKGGANGRVASFRQREQQAQRAG